MMIYKRAGYILPLLIFLFCSLQLFSGEGAYVTAKQGTTLKTEAASGSEVLGTVPYGINLTVVESKGSYTLVTLTDYRGWVLTKDISENDPQAELKARVGELLNSGWFPIVDRYGEYVADWNPRDSFHYSEDREAVELDIILEPVYYYISEVAELEEGFTLKVYEYDPVKGDSWDIVIKFLNDGELLRFDGVIQGVYVKSEQADSYFKVAEKEQLKLNAASIRGDWLIDIFTTLELKSDGKAFMISHGDDIEASWKLDSDSLTLTIEFLEQGIKNISWDLLFLHNEYMIINSVKGKMIIPRSTY